MIEVLVVDDDTRVAAVNAAYVEKVEGFHVAGEAHSAAGALQYLVKPFAFAGLRTKLEAYAKLRRTLDGGGEAEQAEVDRIFGALSASSEPGLPKGHSPTTAELVRRSLMNAEGPLSAHEIAERTGVSRQTAQRYLKLLERTGRARLTLKYGDAGRPEHRYVWATRA
jgi:two-component system CitB family response regulator